MTVETLKSIPSFSEVPDDQIQWLIDHAEEVTLKKDDAVFVPGDPIESLMIVLAGRYEIKLKQGNNFKKVADVETHDITGFLPYSRATNTLAYGICKEDTRLLVLSKPRCREMATKFYELTAVFVHTMTSRTREFAKRNVQNEKMMALGKLSAGLAHELNNPASAMLRSAEELKKHLSTVPEKFKNVLSIRVTEELVDVVNDLIFEKIGNKEQVELSMLEKADREDELEFWLEEVGVENAYDLTETLVDFGFEKEELITLREKVGIKDFIPTINWVCNNLTTEKFVEEIQEAADRISKLVTSVKTYTHMDSSPERHKTDLTKGMKSTITMLNHKIKRKGIQLDFTYDQELSQPKVMVSEINQVWTNIIDNAIDAMESGGKLGIKMENNGSCVRTEIKDSGKGISEVDIGKIFDPFFTTKGIGEGTGMGLDVVNRIINQHNGYIKVKSKPGETIFTIDLPIEN